MSQVFSRHRDGPLSYLRGGQGPTLLLLHGIPGSAHTWKWAGTLLSAHFDVILPDLGGFGESKDMESNTYLDHDLYMEAHAESVHRLLEALDIDTLFLGGHNFGGPVSLTLLRLFPQYTVERLVLSATNLFTDTDVPLPLRLASLPGLGTALCWLLSGTRPGLHTLYWASTYNKTTFRRADFDRHLTASGIDQTRRIFRRSLSNLQTNYQEVEGLLPDLDMPTLVLWGDHDPFFSVEDAKRLVNAIPEAELSLFENTGHFVPEERPELTAWHIDDFLRGRSTPEAGSKKRWTSS